VGVQAARSDRRRYDRGSRWLWRVRRPFGPIVLLLLFAFVSVEIYRAVEPPESFYRHEFEHNAHRKLPESARIIARNASYPDPFGDYCSAAVFEVDEADWEMLQSSLGDDDTKPRESFGSSCVDAVAAQLGRHVAVVRGPQRLKEGGEFFEWGSVGGERRVMFHYASW